jgi:hypothetical protein
MTNDAWEKDRAAHELFEQGRAAFREIHKAMTVLLIESITHGQLGRLETALAREWRAIEQMEVAIELLRAGLSSSYACPGQWPIYSPGWRTVQSYTRPPVGLVAEKSVLSR